MNPNRWKKIKKLFEKAVDLPENKQLTFLHNNEEDATIIDEVMQLISAEREDATTSNQGLQTIVVSSAHKLFFEQNKLNSGDQIGAYTIKELIGEGGMGSVYLAYRTDNQFEQEVAIKISRQLTRQSELSARFALERQLLGQLIHPAIARIYDAGDTADGYSFIIMEYINGQNLLTYCDENQLTIPHRLKLFNKVCHAIQFAHQKGIIHKDLKPANILVSEIDGQATPKIIDFGIAQNNLQPKPTDDGSTIKNLEKAVDTSKLTDTVPQNTAQDSYARVGTPIYMSPEQITHPDKIDTRSDVYSLGVLLYQLLSGTTPYKIDSFNYSNLIEAKSNIQLPSEIFSLSCNQQKISTTRQLSPSKLLKMLKGEIDAIITKSMSFEANMRYQSAAQLADDINRYLSLSPVQAMSQKPIYKFKKFIRRNSLPTALASLFFIGLVAAIFLTTNAMLKEKKARLSAQFESEKTQVINNYLIEMFSSVDPRKKGMQVKVIDILDTAEQNIQETFSEKPIIQASLLTTFGQSRIGLGDYKKAETLLNQALAIYQQNLGPNHFKTLTVTNLIGEAFGNQYQLEKALNIFEPALLLAKKHLGQRHRLTMTLINNVATNNYYIALDNNDDKASQKSLSMMEELLEIRTEVLGEEHEETSHARNNLATMYGEFKQHDKSLMLFHKNHKIQLKIFGENNHYTLTTLSNISWQYNRLKNYDLAEQYARQSYNGLKTIQGTSHINTLRVAVPLLNLLVKQNKIKDAKNLIGEIESEIREKKVVQNWFDKASYELVKKELNLSEKTTE
ncbi:protein kinase domain-containing protein [Aliikangiella sp. IMCC44359]|uniref:protein kinase domain-containing protein n=1 Tax=Aliikangiella sp. IMCC44359 TaxID=3459125 RepID=UPI00403AC8FF